jgi:hypothetical protein
VLERRQGADAGRDAGLEDEVNNHWAELFKAHSSRPSLVWEPSWALVLMAVATRVLLFKR